MPTYIFSKEVIEKIHTGEVSAAIFPRSKQGVAGMRAYFFETSHLVQLAASSRLQSVTPIVVDIEKCLLDKEIPTSDTLDKILKACGFESYTALVNSIQLQFTLPFEGRLHSWFPPANNSPTTSKQSAA
jgi:hypothetical protein